MTRDVLRRWLRKAYDAGFDASGEGWNAEYPFGCSEGWRRANDQARVLEHQRRYDAESEKALDAIVAEISIEDQPASTATP